MNLRELNFSDSQQLVYDAVTKLESKKSKNQYYENKFILTEGKAGTRKSFLINAIRKNSEYSNSDSDYDITDTMVLAPTGIAAVNIKGDTLYKGLSIHPSNIKTNDNRNFYGFKKDLLKNSIKRIIIDEISMVSPITLDFIFRKFINTFHQKDFSKFKRDNKIQFVFVGDMGQLEAIESQADLTKGGYTSNSFLDSKYLKMLLEESNTNTEESKARVLQKFKLDTIFRQSDSDFIEALNRVRETDRLDPYFTKFLTKTITDKTATVLSPYKEVTAKINKDCLDELQTPLVELTGEVGGESPSTFKQSDFIAEYELSVKDGCKVMTVINDDSISIVNGFITTLTIRDNKLFIVNMRGHLVELLPKKFAKYSYIPKEEDGILTTIAQVDVSLTQYPIIVAYALTIHKCQGVTLSSNAVIDARKKMFAKNQLYVALSRVSDPKYLQILV